MMRVRRHFFVFVIISDIDYSIFGRMRHPDLGILNIRVLKPIFTATSLENENRLTQSRPGENAIRVPLSFHFIGAFENCLKDNDDDIAVSLSMLSSFFNTTS